jgi:hypothetical protein
MEHKSERLMQTALAHGWKAQVKTEIPENLDANEIVWNLYCVRRMETMHVEFLGNRQIGATYAYGPYYRLAPSCRSVVVRLLTNLPDPRKLKLQVDDVQTEMDTLRNVPWTHDAPAIEIMLAVLDKDIAWVRKMDGEICRGTITKRSNLGSKHFRVYESPPQSGQRVLDWMDREGFHTARIESIIEVL